MRAALIVLVTLAGCGKGKEECRVEAEAVGALLVSVASEPATPFEIDTDLHLIKRTDIKPVALPRAPTLALKATAMRFEGKGVDAAGLAAGLHGTMAKIAADPYRKQHRAKEPLERIYVLVDEATPWSAVVSAVGIAATEGFTAPAFVFEQPQTVTPPPRTSIDDRLDQILKTESGNRATELAREMSKIIAGCRALEQAFGAVGPVEADNKAMMLSRAIAPSLVECNCNVDVPALRSLMFRVIYVPRPPRVIAFDPKATAETLAFPGDTTWAEASKRFQPALKNATLEVR